MAISKRLRFEILRRDGNTCRYCGSGGTIANPLVVDHVMPSSLGGPDHPSNLVASCTDCNAGKTSSLSAHVTVTDLPSDALTSALKMCALAWQRIRDLEAEAERAAVETARNAVVQFVSDALAEYSESWDVHELVDTYSLDVDARLTGDDHLLAVFRELFSAALSGQDWLLRELDDTLKLLPSDAWLRSGEEAQRQVYCAGDDSTVTYAATHARLARELLRAEDPGGFYSASTEATLAAMTDGPF